MNSNFWDEVYAKKTENEMSWYQENPEKSLELIREFNLNLNDKIIDIGGGDSKLVDHLLHMGFKDITVLDISALALEKAKKRLKDKINFIQFVASDVTAFKPVEKYNLWHDRATFHFLTKLEDVEKYLQIANESLADNGFLIISTFSKTGPEKCSGLSICQYSESELKTLFGKYFTNIRCFEDAHHTPWNTTQNFVYCGFKKRL
jgi:ubiquinone/menaquinone biosynthesis C-methylase UbiE